MTLFIKLWRSAGVFIRKFAIVIAVFKCLT